MYKKSLLALLLLSYLQADSISVQKIATIPEASGIDYSSSTDTLFVANDEGKIYEISTDGKILREKRVCRCDLEGIADFSKKIFLAVDEKSDTILFISKKSLKIKDKLKIDSSITKEIKKNRKEGFEAISYDGKYIYLGLQSKSAPSYIVVVDIDGKLDRVIKIKTKDIAGLKVIGDRLYALSDKKDKLYIINLKKDKIVDKLSVGNSDQEGITFVDNKLYIADDRGSILKQR
jgi:uncharacterized protein YjiK